MSASLTSLQQLIDTAVEEVDSAIAYWEGSRPADRNRDLLERVSNTYEANTFLTIRWSLTAQTALALSRLWDRRSDSLGFQRIDQLLDSVSVQSAIRAKRAAEVVDRFDQTRLASSGMPLAADTEMFRILAQRLQADRDEARHSATRAIGRWRALFVEYRDCRIAADLEKLRALRNKHLAHREVVRADARPSTPPISFRGLGRVLSASEILVQQLRTMVGDSDPCFLDAHRIQARYAAVFWDIVRCSPRTRPGMRRRRPETL